MTINQSPGINYPLNLNEYPATEVQIVEWDLFINRQSRCNNLSIIGSMENIDHLLTESLIFNTCFHQNQRYSLL
nr:hypothetical protein [Mucilaginibacter sp. FT3.2]